MSLSIALQDTNKMAEQLEETPGSLTNSVLMDSEVLFDICCDICIDDGIQREADGFCVDCSDYLCQECFKAHRKTKMSRNHQLLDKISMPHRMPSSAAETTGGSRTDKGTEPCEHHPDRIAEYYCKDHEQLGCSVCMTDSHRTCKGVDHILDLTQGLLECQEYKRYEDDLTELEAKSIQIIHDAQDIVTNSERNSNDTIQKIIDLQHKVNRVFDSFVDGVRKQLNATKVENCERMKTLTETGNRILSDAKKISQITDVLKRTDKLCRLFIHMKKSHEEIKNLAKSIKEVESKNTLTYYFFQASANVQGIIDGSAFLGRIYTTTLQTGTAPISTDAQNVTAKHVRDVNVMTDADRLKYSRISGLAILPDNKLILADRFNGKIKLLDLDTSVITSELKLTTEPWDLAAVGTQVATTLPACKKIVFTETGNTLMELRHIEVDGECRGIACFNETLIVTFAEPNNHVAVMDIYGCVKRKIRVDNAQLLSHVAYEPGSQKIYLSDYDRGTSGHVICMQLDGSKEVSRKTDSIKGPRGVVVDQLGRLIVCGQKSGKVFLLNSDLSVAKILVDGQSWPTGLCYSPQTNLLYEGLYDSCLIRVYRLS